MPRPSRKIVMIERRWKARFGEPPSLRTDPDLMLRILQDDERRARAQPKCGAEADHGI